MKRAGNQASLDSQTVLLRANDLANQVGKLPVQRIFPNVWWGVIGAVLAVIFALWLVITLVRDQRKRLVETNDLNQRNQEAIMRLLDEMGSLAEGDLTVKATVTEDNTASRRLFASFARSRGAELTWSEGVRATDFPDGHDGEPRLHISPLTRS